MDQMKKDDSFKEDEDFESNYYRANKIKVKKVIVQGQSSKILLVETRPGRTVTGVPGQRTVWFLQRTTTRSDFHFLRFSNFQKIKHLMLSGHHQFEWRLYSTWCLEHF